MEFDLVFEGGGAKGLAFVGALQAFERRGHTPRRVLGTSAGSIVAVLVAAGYNAAECMAAQPFARRRGRHAQLRQLRAQPVARREISASAREDHGAHQPGQLAVRKIAQQAVQLFLRAIQQVAAGPFDDGQVVARRAIVVVVLEHH